MSSTNRRDRGGEGRDYFPTPAWCVHRLLEACPLSGGDWLEPAAGDGAIIRAVNEKRSNVRWWANEPHQKPVGIQARITSLDFRAIDPAAEAAVDVIITNPPFGLAFKDDHRCPRCGYDPDKPLP